MDNIKNEFNLSSENAASLSYGDVTYGVANSDVAAPSQPAVRSVGIISDINYFFSEYLIGILFVLCSTLFIFAVPVWLAKPRKAMEMLSLAVKRSVDFLGAILGLLLTLPIWVVVPVLIKLTSPGPVFYMQERVGINRRKGDRRMYQKDGIKQRRTDDRRKNNVMGKPFRVIKFRTMVQDAEKKCGPVWATKNDPRITPIGNFLRKTRIDEIPQFLNVLTGDMSLVGPRPERPNFVTDLSRQVDGYTDRLQVKPGITGLAQVEAGYDTSIDSVVEKVRLDREYIGNRSLWYDIKIMLKTVIVVFTGRGAC